VNQESAIDVVKIPVTIMNSHDYFVHLLLIIAGIENKTSKSASCFHFLYSNNKYNFAIKSRLSISNRTIIVPCQFQFLRTSSFDRFLEVRRDKLTQVLVVETNKLSRLMNSITNRTVRF